MLKLNEKSMMFGACVLTIAIIGMSAHINYNNKLHFDCNEKSAKVVGKIITEASKRKSPDNFLVFKLSNSKEIKTEGNKKVCRAKTNMSGSLDYIRYTLIKSEDGQVQASFDLRDSMAENTFRHGVMEQYGDFFKGF